MRKFLCLPALLCLGFSFPSYAQIQLMYCKTPEGGSIPCKANSEGALVTSPEGTSSTITITGPSGNPVLTTANSSQVLFTAGSISNCFLIQNPSSAAGQNIATAEIIYVDLTGAPASAGSATSIEVLPGGSITCAGKPAASVSISWTAATSGHSVKAQRW